VEDWGQNFCNVGEGGGKELGERGKWGKLEGARKFIYRGAGRKGTFGWDVEIRRGSKISNAELLS